MNRGKEVVKTEIIEEAYRFNGKENYSRCHLNKDDSEYLTKAPNSSLKITNKNFISCLSLLKINNASDLI